MSAGDHILWYSSMSVSSFTGICGPSGTYSWKSYGDDCGVRGGSSGGVRVRRAGLM